MNESSDEAPMNFETFRTSNINRDKQQKNQNLIASNNMFGPSADRGTIAPLHRNQKNLLKQIRQLPVA